MKLRTKKTVPQANRIFTDREEPRASFWKNYNLFKSSMVDGDMVKVLTYYGIGGIGKTSLLHKLISELGEQISQPQYVYFDFNYKQDARSVLEVIKNKLEAEYKFKFPLFDLGMFLYARSMGEKVEEPAVQSYIDQSPFLSLVVETAGVIPGVDTVANIIKIADKGFSYFREKLNNHKDDLLGIEYEKAEDIYAKLPYLFSQDLADNLSEAKEPFVFFFDTYEKLVNEAASIGEPLNNDLWIRGEEGLIQNTPNVLWVISGREKLKWERFDPDWASSLDQHILGSLSKTDTINFLTGAGIHDEELCKDIYDLTKGTPVYLDLCVERYFSLLDKSIKPRIGHFGQDIYTLIERFSKYMDDSRKDIIYMLSCLQSWSDELMASVANTILPGFSMTTYEKVKGFSFIVKSDEGLYNIDQTMGEVFYKDCPSYIKEKTLNVMTEFYSDKLEKLDVFSSDYVYYLQRLMKFALQQDFSDEQLMEFYSKEIDYYLDELFESGQFDVGSMILTPYLERASKNRETVLYASAIEEYSYLLLNRGQYNDSVVYAKDAYETYKKLLGVEAEKTINALRNYAGCLNGAGQYQQAYELNKQIYDYYCETLGKDDFETTCALENVGNSLIHLGKYSEALSVIENVLEKTKAELGEDDLGTIDTMNLLYMVLSDLGKYEDALMIIEKVFDKRKELLGENHPDTIDAMNNVGTAYSELGRYEDSLTILQEVLNKKKEAFGEHHPSTLDSLTNIGVVLSDLGRYDEALDVAKKVYCMNKEILGESHPSTLDALNNIGVALSDLERNDESLEVKQELLNKTREVLGEKHPSTIRVMNNIAASLSGLERYDESLDVSKKVYELYKEVLGENHPDTLMALANIGVALNGLERFDESYTICKDVVNQRTAILGKEHPDTLEAMNNLGSALVNLGNDKEAVKIYKEVLNVRKKILGLSHIDTISSMEMVCDVLENLEQYNEALKLRKEVLETRKQ